MRRIYPAPLLVHFVSGQGDRFSFATFLHVLAAFEAFGAARVFVHHAGDVAAGRWWWTQLHLHPRVTLREIQEVDTIFGHPLTSHAHKADIVRLEALLEFGGGELLSKRLAIMTVARVCARPSGVYLDTDALALRSIDHLLRAPSVAMAVERPAGLINAMIIAPMPAASFCLMSSAPTNI